MNTPTFFVVPAADKTVRDPQTGRALPADGALKEKSAYWLCRVRDGDVRVQPATKPAAQAPSKPAASAAKQGDAK